MKSNILLVGLDYEFIKKVATKLADSFDMFFLDANRLIEYSLIDVENVKLKCGIEYFEKEVKKIILSVKDYENAIISFPYNLYLKNEIELKSGAITILLKINRRQLEKLNLNKDANNQLSTEILTCEELNILLEKATNMSVDIKTLDVDSCVEEIINTLRQNLENI